MWQPPAHRTGPTIYRRGIVLINHRRVGILAENPEGFVFTYDLEYLAERGAQPVSLTLPLRLLPYHAPVLFPFFYGLLTGGAMAHRHSRALSSDDGDTFGRLLETCQDTIGAVTVEPLADA
jgi:serine/threonine-protein kinase HipA